MATRVEETDRTRTDDPGRKLERAGAWIVRYGLAIVLIWVGLLKFTAYEAEGVQGFVSNSPFLSWAYSVFSVRSFAALLGVIEILCGLLILTRPIAPMISAIGSLGAVVIFLTTMTFLLTTPGVWQPDYGFPFLSAVPGQFLAKDLVLLGAALWSAGEALCAASWRNARPLTA